MGTINVCKRIIQQAYRNKILLILALVPIVAFLVATLFTLSSSRVIVIGVIDEDQTELSDAFIRMIDENESFQMHTQIADVDEMLDMLRSRDITIGMRINPNFYENLESIGSVELFQVYDIQTFLLVELYLNSSIDNLIILGRATEDEAELVTELKRHIDEESVATHVLENERARGFFSTSSFGFLMMFMLLVAVLSSKLIADDRFNLTIKRIFVTPIRKSSYFFAGFLSNFIFQMMQVAIIMIISLIMNFQFSIPMYAVLALFTVFAVFASFFGMWIGFVSKSMNQMIITSQMFILPGTLLSGTFFRFTIMPDWLQRVAFIFPQTWINQATVYYDEGLSGPYFAAMFGYFALLCVVIGIYLIVIFKKKKIGSFH